jgi:hypothetical protein
MHFEIVALSPHKVAASICSTASVASLERPEPWPPIVLRLSETRLADYDSHAKVAEFTGCSSLEV